jgi:uncharacterized membrane protein
MNSASAYLRTIRGPILMITVGALLAIDHLGAYPFWRTWPVLLVVIGIMTLAERSAGRGSEEGRPQP